MQSNTIMVVDDCDLSQMIAAMQIAEVDPSVAIIEAYDGQEALEKLREMPAQPDIIFLDINMPRMNGFQFLEAYQSEFEHQSRVAVMSSSRLDQDRCSAEQYPCVKHYFTKPFAKVYLTQATMPDMQGN
ncbi:response regulator [Sphingomonadaceae bacterium]|nr:response regulator [Sphingomonadaceae bacterium]